MEEKLRTLELAFRKKGSLALAAKNDRQSRKLNSMLTLEATIWFDAADMVKESMK